MSQDGRPAEGLPRAHEDDAAPAPTRAPGARERSVRVNPPREDSGPAAQGTPAADGAGAPGAPPADGATAQGAPAADGSGPQGAPPPAGPGARGTGRAGARPASVRASGHFARVRAGETAARVLPTRTQTWREVGLARQLSRSAVKQARLQLVVFVPLLIALLAVWNWRVALFGRAWDTPVRVGVVVALLMLGWQVA